MKIGMLWFDENSEMGITQRIKRASDYYHSKYGHKPNLCFVNPETIGGKQVLPGSAMKVKSSPTLLHDHFWIGVEEESD